MEQKVLSKKHYSDRLSLLFLKDSINSEISETITDTPEINDHNKPKNAPPIITTNKPIRSIF